MVQSVSSPSSYPQVSSYHQNDDEIDLRELLNTLWQGKLLIILTTIIFTIGAVSYALIAQQWWSSKARITFPQIQDFSKYQLQVKQFQPVFDLYKNDGSVLVSKALDSLVNNEELFRSFITAFNSNVNKRAFLDANPVFQEFKSKIDTDTDTDDEATRRLYSKWFSKLSASQPEKKREDIFELSVQATTKSDSYKMLNNYIAYISNVVNKNFLKNLEVTITVKNNELLQQKSALSFQTKRSLGVEIQRAEYALQIAQAANVIKPVQNLGNKEIFTINIGSTAIAAKVKALKSVKDLSVIEPGLQKIESKLTLIKNTQINNSIQFNTFRYLEKPQLPLDRDKPKRALIVILGTLFGGMLGMSIVLVRYFVKT